MALSPEEATELLATLQLHGWFWRAETLLAPAESIWLDKHHPWDGNLSDMCDRMTARLARIRRNRDMYDDPAEFAGVERDTAILVEVLRRMAHP